MPRNAENDDRERALLEREQRRMRRVRLVSSRYRQRRAVTETKPLSPQDVFCTERRVADRFEQLERNKNPRLYSGEPFSSRSSVHRVHLTGDILAPLSPRRTAPCLEREASRGTRELSERVQLYAVKAASSGTTEALSNAGAAGKRAVGEEDIARLSGIGQSGQAAQERPMQLLPNEYGIAPEEPSKSYGHRPSSASRHLDVLSMSAVRPATSLGRQTAAVDRERPLAEWEEDAATEDAAMSSSAHSLARVSPVGRMSRLRRGKRGEEEGRGPATAAARQIDPSRSPAALKAAASAGELSLLASNVDQRTRGKHSRARGARLLEALARQSRGKHAFLPSSQPDIPGSTQTGKAGAPTGLLSSTQLQRIVSGTGRLSEELSREMYASHGDLLSKEALRRAHAKGLMQSERQASRAAGRRPPSRGTSRAKQAGEEKREKEKEEKKEAEEEEDVGPPPPSRGGASRASQASTMVVTPRVRSRAHIPDRLRPEEPPEQAEDAATREYWESLVMARPRPETRDMATTRAGALDSAVEMREMLAEGATTEEARAESERLHALRRQPPTGLQGSRDELAAAESGWHVPLALSPSLHAREPPMQYGVGLPQPQRPIERIERFEKLAAGTLEFPLALAHHRTDAALKKETEYRRDGLHGRMYSKRYPWLHTTSPRNMHDDNERVNALRHRVRYKTPQDLPERQQRELAAVHRRGHPGRGAMRRRRDYLGGVHAGKVKRELAQQRRRREARRAEQLAREDEERDLRLRRMAGEAVSSEEEAEEEEGEEDWQGTRQSTMRRRESRGAPSSPLYAPSQRSAASRTPTSRRAATMAPPVRHDPSSPLVV